MGWVQGRDRKRGPHDSEAWPGGAALKPRAEVGMLALPVADAQDLVAEVCSGPPWSGQVFLVFGVGWGVSPATLFPRLCLRAGGP